MRPDILLFMSDQHAPQFMAGAEMEVDTPNLDALRREGTSFSEAYTACPLCVPARMAMLSGMRAARTGIFTNNDALPDTLPTFLHHLAAAGYETVLVGRILQYFNFCFMVLSFPCYFLKYPVLASKKEKNAREAFSIRIVLNYLSKIQTLKFCKAN